MFPGAQNEETGMKKPNHTALKQGAKNRAHRGESDLIEWVMLLGSKPSQHRATARLYRVSFMPDFVLIPAPRRGAAWNSGIRNPGSLGFDPILARSISSSC
jgi:hypothetical protein